MEVFVIMNDVAIMINVHANVKNWLIKAYLIKDIFEILVIVSVNVINYVMLASTWIMKIASVEKVGR